jgi:hypothetical protein
VLARLRPEGPPSVLSARGARAIRAAAVLAVFVEGCVNRPREVVREQPAAAPSAAAASAAVPPGPPSAAQPAMDRFPAEMDQAALTAHFLIIKGDVWRPMMRELLAPHPAGASLGAARRLVEMLGRKRPSAAHAFSDRMGEHLTRREGGEEDGPARLLLLLEAAESMPVFDVALVAYLWQRTAPLPAALDPAASAARATLFARLDRHIRVAEALRAGEARAGRVEFSAWRSKAAPPLDYQGKVLVPPALLDEARNAFPAASSDPWKRGGALPLSMLRSSGTVVLVRPGALEPLEPGRSFNLRRLDVVRAVAPCTLRHETLGELNLAGGEELTLYNVDRYLSVDARKLVDARVAAALDDPAALAQLEPLVAAAHRVLRDRLAADPGDPRLEPLRMLLVQLDE